MTDWRDLRNGFVAALEAAPRDTTASGQFLWRTIVEHPWFQHELQVAARRVVAEKRVVPDLAEDISQTALILLAQELRRLPNLGWDRGRDEERFPGWLRTIIVRDCRLALRRLRRSWSREREALTDELLARDRAELLDCRYDLDEALGRLEERARAVVLWRRQGGSIREIAAAWQEPYHTVYSIWRRAIVRLRDELNA